MLYLKSKLNAIELEQNLKNEQLVKGTVTGLVNSNWKKNAVSRTSDCY